MKKGRKDFIKKAHENACSEWKTKIEKEFPKLFKEGVLAEARKRYKDGDVYKSAFSGSSYTVKNINSIKLDSDGDIRVDSRGYLFVNGKWATIIKETITKEQAEKAKEVLAQYNKQ